jgi:HK97 gp10 family phage protein
MANRITLGFEGIEDMAKELDRMEGRLEAAAISALEATHRHVTENLKEATAKGNMPARGEYWTGNAKKNIIETPKVEKAGLVFSVGVGFSVRDALETIFLMYGTPRMNPVKKMRDALDGSATKNKIKEMQQEAFGKWMT